MSQVCVEDAGVLDGIDDAGPPADEVGQRRTDEIICIHGLLEDPAHTMSCTTDVMLPQCYVLCDIMRRRGGGERAR